MGCGIALRLRQAGVQVTVLERSIPGAEASSAAAGILAPQMESEGPGPFLELCLRSRALYGALATELRELTGVDIAYLPCGVLKAAFTEADVHHLEATVAWQQRARPARRAPRWQAGPRARAPALPQRPRRRALPGRSPGRQPAPRPRPLHGRGPRGRHLPQRLRARRRRGERPRRRRGPRRRAALAPDAVVVAAGSWSGLVHGAALDPQVVRPARGQMIQLQTRLPLTSHILTSEKGYLVPRTDGRLIAGSTMEFAGFDKQVTAEGLAAHPRHGPGALPCPGHRPRHRDVGRLPPLHRGPRSPSWAPVPCLACSWPPATSATASSWPPSPRNSLRSVCWVSVPPWTSRPSGMTGSVLGLQPEATCRTRIGGQPGRQGRW